MNTVLLGPPGAGKGTQAEFLSTARDLIHLSTGDLLRAAVAAGTKLGLEAKGYMDRGALVPDELVLALLRERIADPEGHAGFLLDGFPRNVAQAEALAATLGEGAIRHVVYLQLEDAEIIRRLLGRGRPDDVEEVIRNRLNVFRADTEPLVAYYRGQGLLRAVDGMGSIEDIQNRVLQALDAESTGARA